MTQPFEDEFTELVDADIQRVDLVGKGANGLPFLIAKSAVLAPEFVADLIEKATPETPPDGASKESTVTVTGSPAAIAEMIAKAPIRQTVVEKKTFDTAERKHDAATGAAMPNGSYPIENESQLEDAIHAVGRGSGNHDAIRRHIISRAKSLGASSKIPDNWNADGSLSVAKADMEAPVDATDLIPNPEAGDPDASAPGSPEWEQLDGDTACQLISVLGRVKAAISWLSDREAQEAVTVDPDDAGNVCDLDAACCAVDNAISILAPFAAGEHLEAELAGELETLGKAARDAAAPLAVLEPLAAVAKAGRVLSTSNEQAIRSAVEALSKVLASLPAPVDDESVAKADVKEADMADAGTIAVNVVPVVDEEALTKAVETIEETVAKADSDAKNPMVAVYNADGKLVGVVDQSDINPIAAPEAPDGGDEQGSSEASDDSSEAAPAAARDAAPAEPDAREIPGTDTIQSPPQNNDDDDVAKSDPTVQRFAAGLAAALEEALTPLAKQNTDLAGMVQVLKERVDKFGLTPDDRNSPVLNGGTGTPGAAVRDTTVTVDEAADLAKQAADETDPKRKQELSFAAAFAAVKKAQTGQPVRGTQIPNFEQVLARFTQ